MSLDSRKWFAPPAIVLAAAAALVVCSQPSRVGSAAFAAQTTRLKIGVDLPLSGAEAAGNIPTENGVLLAIEEAGRAGFAPGYTLAPYVLDDAVEGKHDPAQGAQNVRTFIADPSVLGIVGPANSNVAKAEIPITNDAGLVQIAASTTADGLTRGPDAARLRVEHPDTTTFFRLCTLDSLQGAAGARFARKLGLNKAFIIDDNETYGKGLADVFEQKFGSAGGTIVGHEHILPTQTDFTPLLSKVRGAGADVIFYGGVSSTGGGLLRRQQVNNGCGRNVLHGFRARRDALAGSPRVRRRISSSLQGRPRAIQRQWLRGGEDHHRGAFAVDRPRSRRPAESRASARQRRGNEELFDSGRLDQLRSLRRYDGTNLEFIPGRARQSSLHQPNRGREHEVREGRRRSISGRGTYGEGQRPALLADIRVRASCRTFSAVAARPRPA